MAAEEEIRVAGWYPLPGGAPGHRFWDGFQWSLEHRFTIEQTSHDRRVANRYGRPPLGVLVAWVYLMLLGLIALLDLSRVL